MSDRMTKHEFGGRWTLIKLDLLERYLTFYNQTRPHQALDGQTPDQVYYDNRTTPQTTA